jgi:hypothetical protein
VVCGPSATIPFAVLVDGGGPDSFFFIISTPPDTDDHYVQAEIFNRHFSDDINLGENEDYFEEPELVAVYEATGDAARRIRHAIVPASGRLPIDDWSGLTPAPTPVGSIGVIRRPSEDCRG